MPAQSPQERSAIARIASHESWATTPDRAARTANCQEQASWPDSEDPVDPDRILSPAERARRAEHKRIAYFQRLALKSVQARRKGSRPRLPKRDAADAALAELDVDEIDQCLKTILPSASAGSAVQ